MPNRILIPYISQDNIEHKYYIKEKNRSNIFASGLYPRNKNENEYIYSIISEPLLLYDEVYITKDDLCYLLSVIDHVIIGEFLDSGILKIIDTDSFRFIRSKDSDTNIDYFLTDFGQQGKAGFRDELNQITSEFSRKISNSEIIFDNKPQFIDSVIKESNDDLRNSKLIDSLNLDSTIVSGGHKIPLNNYKLNRIFYMNYFYAVQAKLGIEYSFQDDYLYRLFCTKVKAYEKERYDVDEVFFNILNFNNILDVRSLVAQGRLPIGQLLEIRESKNCKQFRDWIFGVQIEKENPSENLDIIRAYHDACLSKGKVEKITSSMTYKTLNTIIPTAVGFIPIAGPIICGLYSAFDNFKDIFIKDWKPNFFIDDLKRY